ncbi:MAG TPA: methyltransferase domain-containing protein [Steroidobacteraceae bacterium]|nr:methyltransferase domain-containing protein [Steroidobacteraceae bacterium]
MSAASPHPRPWTDIGRHDLLPEASHDEVARLNTVAHLNRFLAQRLVPTVERAWKRRVQPGHIARFGRLPTDRHEARKALESEPTYQIWSTLRRNTMEMRQQIGRALVLRQAERLAAVAERHNAGASTLLLDESLDVPAYVRDIDVHLMPGGYTAETFPGDVSPAANYDAGLFATLGGAAGEFNDAAGRALVAWLGREHPDFKPKHILDLGCGLGHNTLPLARAFPDSLVVAVDVAAPMLRYGHARARSLGVDNVCFVQADATRLSGTMPSFDLVYTTMVLHETSRRSVEALFDIARRQLRLGGLTIHLEQPPYRGQDVFEQCMRDWDGRYNNEPFWSALHELDLPMLLEVAGFERESIFETRVVASEADPGQEDFGRAPAWYAVGARA